MPVELSSPLHVTPSHHFSTTRKVLSLSLVDTANYRGVPCFLTEPYQVTVVTLTGSSCQVWVRGSELAADMKLKLSLKHGIPVRELCLVHQKETLYDHLSLRQQHIVPGSSVHLILVAGEDCEQEVTYVGPLTAPVLSITHMRLGVGLEQIWSSPPPSSSQSTRIPLPAHLQHLVQVYDIPNEVMTLLLAYLYSGELPAIIPNCEWSMALITCRLQSELISLSLSFSHTHTHTHTHTPSHSPLPSFSLSLTQGNRPLLLASCCLLAEFFRVRALSLQCLQLLKDCLTVESAVQLVKVAESTQCTELHHVCVGYLENLK